MTDNKLLRSPLGRVRGLGSAGGSAEWWATRLTSVALVPLSLWFVVSVIGLLGATRTDVVHWLKAPVPAILAVLFLGTVFHHTYTGLKTVVEDYVHAERVKLAVIAALALACTALAVAGIFAVLKISFGGV